MESILANGAANVNASGALDKPSIGEWRTKAAGLNLKPRGKGLVGPCPVCGGEDRFSVDDHARGALLQCRGCDPNGRTNEGRDAYKAIMEAAGFDGPSAPPARRKRRRASKASAMEPTTVSGSRDDPFTEKDATTLGTVLAECGIDFRWNLRAQIIEYREPGAGAEKCAWTSVDDRFLARVRDEISRRYYFMTDRGPRRLHYGRERFEDSLNALLDWRRVDPFLEWLESLPAWDGTPVIDSILATLFSAPDDELSAWAGRYLFLGACQRAYAPGAKLDEIPVLIGAQGIGKSAFLRSMLPPELADLFSDGLRFDAYPEKQLDAVLGRVIVEVSEMAGRSRADIETMKAFVVRQNDGHVRRPYARHAESQPRRFVMCGTTNVMTDLPNDPSGNRRFVPVVLGASTFRIEDVMDGLRDAAWAEALHRHRAGETAELPRALMAMQTERAEAHRDSDTLIEDAIAGLPKVSLTLGEVVEYLPERLRAMSEHRIGRALKNAGWTMERARVDGKVKRLWQPNA